MTKNIPIGIEDFAELVSHQKNFLFADRTPQLKKVVAEGDKVIAFHNFRRSGKSLFASMLHYFLAPQVLGISTQGMFDELAIGQQDMAFVREYQGQYPVITMTFKEVMASNFDGVKE